MSISDTIQTDMNDSKNTNISVKLCLDCNVSIKKTAHNAIRCKKCQKTKNNVLRQANRLLKFVNRKPVPKDCKSCGKSKPKTRQKSRYCLKCFRIATKARYKKSKEKRKERDKLLRKLYHQKHKERLDVKTKEWRSKNRDKVLASKKRYRKNHLKELVAKVAIRKLKIKRNCPKWANKQALIEIYKNCPEGMVVDHIIPLNSPIVSGLHVPWNLQYLTPYENGTKCNKFDGTYENNGWRNK